MKRKLNEIIEDCKGDRSFAKKLITTHAELSHEEGDQDDFQQAVGMLQELEVLNASS